MNKEIREYDKNVQFEIGQRIQEMRLDKNMKSIELATELGITRNQMSRIENGRANCTIIYYCTDIKLFCRLFIF